MASPGSFASDNNRNKRAPRTTLWKEGDRVLAPWEPTFVYAGTVDQVDEGRALVRFDDGDTGWVDLAHLQALELARGCRVMSRRRMGPNFFPGEIEDVNGENIHVEFDDGKEEWTTVASLRIPCAPMGLGAEQIESTSHMAFREHLEEGTRVWALWNNTALFPGTVSECGEEEVHVRFDDGDEAWVQLEHLLPLDLIVGMRVMGRWRMGSEFYPGAITDTEGDRVQVRYDDGSEEWTTAEALALPLGITQPQPEPEPEPEAPTKVEPEPVSVPTGWNPRTVIAIGALVTTVVAAVSYWLGRR
jgi:hypothetical protein